MTLSGGGDPAERAQPYAYYALLLLTLTNFVNLVDRQILSILAQSVKSDLHLTDAQLGFLLGTAMAVFFAVVGTAIGRTSDLVSRKWTLAIGLAVWSSMTALGGAANNFATLSGARIGVGAGEAAAVPCSHSLLSDYFPARNRATVLATYISGSFLGSATALIFGGWFIQHWPQLCSSLPWSTACSFPGWKAALIAVGLPGLPLAALIACLREPPRGTHHVPEPGRAEAGGARTASAVSGAAGPPSGAAGALLGRADTADPTGARTDRSTAGLARLLLTEFGAAVPPFTVLTLYRAGGVHALQRNLLLIALLTLGAFAMIRLTGDIAQWASIALGAYAIITWGQIQKIRDAALYRLTFGCPTFVMAMLSAGLIACISGAVQSWAAPYAMRTFQLTSAQTGLSVGLTVAGGAAIGVLSGGRITDKWKRVDRRAPIWVALTCLLLGLPGESFLLLADDTQHYLLALAFFSLLTAGWAGAYGALIQDLVLPRMRGTAASAFALVTIVIASGAGPYWVGKVSTLTGSLGRGLLSVQLLLPIATVLLLLTARRLKSETPMRRQARAESAGVLP